MTLDLSRWPGGLQPVWTLLDAASAEALGAEPSPENGALRVAAELDEAALGDSAMVRNARILLKGAAGGQNRLWISSSSGCLTMKCVSRLRTLIAWPGLEETFDVAWRKSALFDRFLSLDVGAQDNRGTGH